MFGPHGNCFLSTSLQCSAKVFPLQQQKRGQPKRGKGGKEQGRGAAANANARVKVFIKCIKRAKVVTTYCVSVVVCVFAGVCVCWCVCAAAVRVYRAT